MPDFVQIYRNFRMFCGLLNDAEKNEPDMNDE